MSVGNDPPDRPGRLPRETEDAPPAKSAHEAGAASDTPADDLPDADDCIRFDDCDPDRWDASDERRRKDPMAPPQEPCECYCLHCRRTFTSDRMWFQRVVGDPQGCEGFWLCPTPNCGGAGFTFDIFPTDPAHPANAGWHSFDDEEADEEEDQDDCEGDDVDEEEDGDWEDFDDPDATGLLPEPDAEYDPDEPEYKFLDEMSADHEDIEGEEWKFGLEPGQRPADPPWAEEARKRWDEEQRRYDEPDRRPRELDWSDREDRKPGSGQQFYDDDIPF